MVYFYSFHTFFSITIAVFLVSAVLIKTCLSFTRKPRLYVFWSVASICFIVSWSFSTICPFYRLRYIFRVIQIIAFFPSVYTTFIVCFSSSRGKNRINLYHFEKIIIDNLREHLVIFDSRGRVVSYGQDNFFCEIFVTNEQPAIPPGHLFFDLNAVLRLNEEHSDTVSDGEQAWFYRYKLLPQGRGSLLTILDISEEQRMLNALQQLRRSLARKEQLIVSLGNLKPEEQVAQIQELITARMDTAVRTQMKSFLSLLDSNPPYRELITAANESLEEVRCMVTELSPWKVSL